MKDFGHPDLASGHQPKRKVVALGMIEQRFIGDGSQFGLKLPQRPRLCDLIAKLVAVNEVAKTQKMRDKTLKVLR